MKWECFAIKTFHVSFFFLSMMIPKFAFSIKLIGKNFFDPPSYVNMREDWKSGFLATSNFIYELGDQSLDLELNKFCLLKSSGIRPLGRSLLALSLPDNSNIIKRWCEFHSQLSLLTLWNLEIPLGPAANIEIL